MQVKRCLEKSSRRRFVCFALGLPALGLWLWVGDGQLRSQENTSGISLETSSLTPQEKVVLKHLREDWAKKYRTTSIGLAAEVLGTRLSDGSRLRLAKFLESNRKAFPVLGRHGTTTVALTSKEKLIARTLLLSELRDKTGSTPDQIVRDLRGSTRSLGRPLDFMHKLGIVLEEGEGNDRLYRLADRFPRRPSYRIDFQSHQVEVNGRDKFEVA